MANTAKLMSAINRRINYLLTDYDYKMLELHVKFNKDEISFKKFKQLHKAYSNKLKTDLRLLVISSIQSMLKG